MADKPSRSAISSGKQSRNGKKYLTTEDVLEALFNDSDSDDEGKIYSNGNSSIDEELSGDDFRKNADFAKKRNSHKKYREAHIFVEIMIVIVFCIYLNISKYVRC